MLAALAAIECAVPAEWPGGVAGLVAGTGGSVGTSWVSVLGGVLAPDAIAVEVLQLCDGVRRVADMIDQLAAKYCGRAFLIFCVVTRRGKRCLSPDKIFGSTILLWECVERE